MKRKKQQKETEKEKERKTHSSTLKGVKFSYIKIDKGLENLGITDNPLLHVLIKDGGDGLGDVSQYKELGDRFIEDKAYRYSFCILKITVKVKDEFITVWEEEAPYQTL